MSDTEEQEFDTEAAWIAEVLEELPARQRIPGACRGSGQPAALGWLADALDPGPSTRFLDLGGGIGGPAAWLDDRSGCKAVIAEPSSAGPRGAGRLFGLSGVACLGPLPFAPAAFDAAWSLATLSTVDDVDAALAELHRVLRHGGGLGLQEYVRRTGEVDDPPADNRFGSEEELVAALDRAGFEVLAVADAGDLPSAPPAWQDDEQRAEHLLAARHEGSGELAAARATEQRFGQLLGDGVLGVLVVHARRRCS